MPAGLEIINTAGTVLVDENYVNLAMRSKGSGSTSGSSGLNRLTVALDGLQTPMIAYACATRHVGHNWFASDMSSTTFQGDLSITATVNYYIFDQPVASGANHGMQIYNAAGVLVFDALNKYARVVDIFGGAALANWTPSRSYPAGRTYAVVQLKKAYQKEVINNGGGNWDVNWYSSAIQVNGVAVTGKMLKYKTDNVSVLPTGAINDPSAQFAVLDVTGY